VTDENETAILQEVKQYSEIYCGKCLSIWISQQLSNSSKDIKCICSVVLKYEIIVAFLKNRDETNLLAKYEKWLLNQTLMHGGISSSGDKYSQCPIPDCQGGGFYSPIDSFVICTVCSIKFCMNCAEEFHTGFSCTERRQWKLEHEDPNAKSEE